LSHTALKRRLNKGQSIGEIIEDRKKERIVIEVRGDNNA